MFEQEECAARIDQCLFGPEFDEFTHWDRMKVYHVALRARAERRTAPRDPRRDYEQIKGSIVEVVEEGIEAGVFRDVDADRMGQLITDVIHVGRERRISLGHEDAPADARRAIDEFILDSLYVED